jgi:hypothetical protein
MKHSATIKQGRVEFVNKEAWTVDCAKHEGISVTIELSKPKSTRSANQNRYLWGIVVPMLCESIGYPVQEAEECWSAVKIAVGHCKHTKIGMVALPTKNLGTKEFSELIDSVRAWASCELSTRIPSPNETDYGV